MAHIDKLEKSHLAIKKITQSINVYYIDITLLSLALASLVE